MLYALRKMAKSRLLWPTSYAKEQHEQYYVLPDDTDFDLIDDHVSEWIQQTEVIDMCNQALLEAIESIAASVTQSSCCYEAGPGGQFIGDDFYYGSEAPLSAPTVFGPGEEFETETEYNNHRCAAANTIVNGLIGSLNGLSILSLAQLTAAGIVAGLVGIGLIAVPPVAIVIALLATGFLLGALTSVANEIDDNKEELVCLLYNSETAQEAYDAIDDFVRDIAVDLGFLEVQIGPFADLVMNIVPIDAANALFSAVGLPVVSGTTIDCDGQCGDCPNYIVIVGGYDPVTNVASSEYFSPHGNYQFGILFERREGELGCSDGVDDLTVVELQPPTPQNSANLGHRAFFDATTRYSDNAPPSNIDNVNYYVSVDDDENYTMQVTWTQ